MKLLKGETGVYLHTLLRSFGMSMVGIFIPIYVYKLTGKLESAFLLFGIYHLLVLLSVLPAGWIIQKIGVDWGSAIGTIFRALFLFFLILGRNNIFFLGLAGVFWGITISFCWLPFHYTVVGAGDGDGRFGRETSWIKIFEKIAGGLGPFFGGLIIVELGFNWLYGLAIFLVLLGGIPLFLDSFTKKGMHFDIESIRKSFLQKENRKFVISFAGHGLKSVVLNTAWPLYIFLIVRKYEVIGGIQTAALLVSLALLWRLGKWIDKKGSGILKYGILINSLIWLARSFLITPLAVFLSNIVYGFGELLTWVPFQALTYEVMLKRKKLEFLIMREMMIHGAGLIVCFLIWQIIRMGVGWFWIFGLGALGLSGVSFVLKRENK